MLLRSFVLWSAWVSLCVLAGAAQDGYKPEPEIEQLIESSAQADKTLAQKAIEQMAGNWPVAQRALNWHLFKENSAAGRRRWADLIARCGRGRVGYRVTLELQPEGSGTLSLWSDRALLADCQKKYDRIMGQPETQFSEEVLTHNPYSKVELLKHMPDGVKSVASHIHAKDSMIEANGTLTFATFDALSRFAASFDEGGYNMLSGIALTDAARGGRTLYVKKPAEDDQAWYEKNLLLFHDVTWEFVLDFKGNINSNNATRTDGSKLVWAFSCHQMLTGAAVVQASFDATGLSPRVAKTDTAVALPPTVKPNQPLAVLRQTNIRAKVSKKVPGVPPPTARLLRERGELIELDGSESLPRDAALLYNWSQTFGPDLGLSQAALAQPYVGFIVREPGEYRFELVVGVNGSFSKPTAVKVMVDDEGAPPVAVKPPDPTSPPKVVEPQKFVAAPESPPKLTPAPVAPPPVATPPVAKKPEVPPVVEPKVADVPKPPVVKPDIPPPAKAPDPVVKAPEPVKPPPVAIKEPEPVKPVPPVVKAPEPVKTVPPVAKAPEPVKAPEPSKPPDAAAAPTPPVAKADPTPAEIAKAKELREKGVKLYKAGKFADSKTAMSEAVALNPADLDAQFDLGTTLMETGDYQPAVASFELVAQSGKNPKAIMNIGHCFSRFGRLDQATPWYRRAVKMNSTLNWESVWQLGNNELRKKQYPRALELLLEGEQMAGPINSKDPRLLRDLVEVFHQSKKDDEAAIRLKALETLGYALNPELANAVNAGGPPSVATVPVTPPAPPVATVTVKEPVKPPVDIEAIKGKPVVKVEPIPGTAIPDVPPVSVKPPVNSDPKTADVVDLSKVNPGPSIAIAPPITPRKPEPKVEPVKPEPVKPEAVRTEPAPPVKTVQAPSLPPLKPDAADAGKPKTVPKKADKPARKPLPPVPTEYVQAMEAGKKAADEALRQSAVNSDEARTKAAQQFDEAEAMYRGAWALKPGDEAAHIALKDISKYVGAIAVPRSMRMKVKSKGLVVLDGEPSIVPDKRGGTSDKRQIFCIWEQVAGEPLNLRPETLAHETVMLRITEPGTYKFELVVSDGVRGGSPATVTVEVE